MKTLLTIFGKERNNLQREIEKATNLDQVVKLVQNQIDNLEKIYIQQLNVAQVRLASFFLDTLRQSIATLAAANESQLTLTNPAIAAPPPKFSPNRVILKTLQALACVGIFGSSFSLTGIAPGAWMPILLTSLVVGLEVANQFDKSDRHNADLPQLKEASQPIVRVDSTVFLDNLTDALNTIDVAVARVEEANKPLDDRGLEELPELLDVIQRLIGASFLEKPQMALALTKLLPQILMEQGIRFQIYQPNDEPSHRDYFDFEPSIDRSSKDYVTITPALLKGDRLLRRGRAIEPVYSEAKD